MCEFVSGLYSVSLISLFFLVYANVYGSFIYNIPKVEMAKHPSAGEGVIVVHRPRGHYTAMKAMSC